MSDLSRCTIVFDLDGTLVDSAPDLLDALTVTLVHEGVEPIPYDHARGLIGAGARALVQRGLDAAGKSVPKERLDALHAFFLHHYSAHIADKTRPYDGCEAALDRLAAAGARLAVCTNKVEPLARQLLDAVGLTSRFHAIVGGDTVGVAKPDARPLLAAIERAGGDPARAVMVGDSSTDVDAAKNAGVPVIVATFGYTETPPSELGGDRLMDHYAEIEGLIRELI